MVLHKKKNNNEFVQYNIKKVSKIINVTRLKVQCNKTNFSVPSWRAETDSKKNIFIYNTFSVLNIIVNVYAVWFCQSLGLQPHY